MRLHGIMKEIMLYRDENFNSKFWKEIFACVGYRVGILYNLSCP